MKRVDNRQAGGHMGPHPTWKGLALFPWFDCLPCQFPVVCDNPGLHPGLPDSFSKISRTALAAVYCEREKDEANLGGSMMNIDDTFLILLLIFQ